MKKKLSVITIVLLVTVLFSAFSVEVFAFSINDEKGTHTLTDDGTLIVNGKGCLREVY